MKGARLIDLSQPIHTGMPVYPILPKTFLQRYHTFEEFEDGRMWPASTDLLVMSTHAGTHIDAPAHIKPGVTTIDQADLTVMFGEAVWLDFSAKSPGEEVSRGELQRGLKDARVELAPRLIVLFHTGMSKRWGQPEYGQKTIGISPDAVEWMLDQGVIVFGLDGPSPDIDYKNLPNHQLLARRPHHHIENLTNLDRIPTPRFTFFGLPIALRGATGAPIRAVALVE